MRCFECIPILVLFLGGLTHAAVDFAVAPVLVGDPPCAASCAVGGLAFTSCSITNQTCLCGDDRWFQDYLQPCIVANCTTDVALAAINATSTLCRRPPTNHIIRFNIILAILTAIPTLCIIVRMALKMAQMCSWSHDDTTIILAWMCFAALLPGGIAVIRWGLVEDMWAISGRRITRFLFVFFIFEPFYFVMVCFVKASILFTYMRIFHGKQVRQVFWATQIFNFAQTVVFVVLSFVQCQPLEHFWLGWTGEHEGWCFHMNVLPVSHAALGVLLDVWMVGLPASLVWQLKLKSREKFGVILMFGCGIFLIIVSSIRIPALVAFSKPTSLTEESLHSALWSSIEVSVGICVACMPNLRQFINLIIAPHVRSILHLPEKPPRGSTYDGGKTARRSAAPSAEAPDLRPPPPIAKMGASCRDSSWSGGSAGDRRSRVTVVNVESVALRPMSGIVSSYPYEQDAADGQVGVVEEQEVEEAGSTEDDVIDAYMWERPRVYSPTRGPSPVQDHEPGTAL